MSLHKYFNVSVSDSDSSTSLANDDILIQKEIDTALKELTKNERSGKGRKNKFYSAAERAKIGRYAAENGNKATIVHFSKILGFELPESTVRGMKKAYLDELKTKKNPTEITELEHKLRGKPLKLGSFDRIVQDYIRKLSESGGVINKNIVKATALGILKFYMYKKWQELKDMITDSWARSLMQRMNMVKRKGNVIAISSCISSRAYYICMMYALYTACTVCYTI